MASPIRTVWEWVTHFETVQAIVHTEFVRTTLWPTVWAAMTGTSGYLGGLPLMWVFMAMAVAFMGVTQALLRQDEYRERRTPRNKLTVMGVQTPCALVPAPILLPFFSGNRSQRRAQQAGYGTSPAAPPVLSAANTMVGVKRIIDKMQIGVSLHNNASFPISCILYKAETEIATMKPPRGTFPKPASTLSAGANFAVFDDTIDMNGIPAGRLTGKIDMVIKYGLPGKEIYELNLKASIDIAMEDYGFISQVAAAWAA